ncbi:MAG: hypothetical protein ACLTR6_15765 [Clostridium fessum]
MRRRVRSIRGRRSTSSTAWNRLWLDADDLLPSAHRLSTVRNANVQSWCWSTGEIIERGDHEDLLAQKGRYFELYTGMKELE